MASTYNRSSFYGSKRSSFPAVLYHREMSFAHIAFNLKKLFILFQTIGQSIGQNWIFN